MAKVDMTNIKSESNSSKLEIATTSKEKKGPVVSKDAILIPKKTLGEKFKETFVSPDIDDAKHILFKDVIVPTIQNTIIDMLEMLFFNSFRRSRTNYRDSTPYGSYYASYQYNGRQYNRRENRSEPRNEEYHSKKIDYRNIILIDQRDAKMVLDRMFSIIDQYGRVSVADLYEAIDITPDYPDFNWGWTDRGDLGIRRVGNGYLIDVAEAKPID